MANSPFPVLRKEVQNYLRACEYRISVLKTPTPTSPSLSQEEREMVAAEALLKIGDLTDPEMEAVQEMLNRLSEKLPNSGNNGKPQVAWAFKRSTRSSRMG